MVEGAVDVFRDHFYSALRYRIRKDPSDEPHDSGWGQTP